MACSGVMANVYLYCARAGDYVKIGVSLNPKSRVRGLRSEANVTRCPAGIERKSVRLEGICIGSEAQEKEFHRQHKNERIAGTKEWYPCGGRAHQAFSDLPGYIAEPKPEPIQQIDPLEQAIWILEGHKTTLRIQRYRSSLTEEEAAAWYILDRASEYLCKQL